MTTAMRTGTSIGKTIPQWQRRGLMAVGCTLLCLSLAGCSGGGVYANVGIAGPSVDLGPVKVHTGVNLGRLL
jgi:hypothetical protein